MSDTHSFERKQLVTIANKTRNAVASSKLFLVDAKCTQNKHFLCCCYFSLQYLYFLVPAFFVFGPVFSIDGDQQLVGVVIQTFLIESLMRDVLIGIDYETIQFLVNVLLLFILFFDLIFFKVD